MSDAGCTLVALEAQAIGRVHRLGQRKPVTVTKFVVKGTVEENIVKWNSDMLANQHTAGAAGAGAGMVHHPNTHAPLCYVSFTRECTLVFHTHMWYEPGNACFDQAQVLVQVQVQARRLLGVDQVVLNATTTEISLPPPSRKSRSNCDGSAWKISSHCLASD